MIHGIDVSVYQSATYSTAGLDFVFTKVTEGLSYVNPRWAAQRDRAKKAGLVWGAYHYPHMANDPRQEADYFLRQVKWQPGDLIVLDWEGYDTANKGVSHARQLAYRDAWLTYVKGRMPGHRVGMYANTDYWLHVDTTSNCGDFLCIATAGRAAGDPGITHPWTFHQYSTAGGIDHDVANFTTRAALAAWAGSTKEDPMAGITKQDIYDAVWSTDAMTPPKGAATDSNPVWMPQSILRDIADRVRAMQAQEAAQTAAITAMAQALAKVDTTLDVAALVAQVHQAVTTATEQALKGITVHLDTTPGA
ncbi:glycoside hydrolase family 25 protein [Streptomyces sp. MUM 16J]|uniref:glycoside hydrolase family 25 protein n=1 Tax=Streptomyces sp. MUM 16J TaxID=2791988 RepID=UPI001F034E49|nr:glycoside hydrolase family 25 protein [Streptomyces sp. MUM 16J]